MFKFFYTIFTSPLGLPINAVWEYIILFVMGEIAHIFAWKISPGGKYGSFIYWASKFAVFVFIWIILYVIIFSIKFIEIYWMSICAVLLCIAWGLRITNKTIKNHTKI